jgi:hypothetical protein
VTVRDFVIFLISTSNTDIDQYVPQEVIVKTPQGDLEVKDLWLRGDNKIVIEVKDDN